jgi:hypothetical protein
MARGAQLTLPDASRPRLENGKDDEHPLLGQAAQPRQLDSRFRTAWLAGGAECSGCRYVLFRLLLMLSVLTRSGGAHHRACRATQHHEQAARTDSERQGLRCCDRSLGCMLAGWGHCVCSSAPATSWPTSERLLGRLFRINDKVCPRCVEYLRPR